MKDNLTKFANKIAEPYRPRINAVIVTLLEHQGEDGSVKRQLSYSIEVKDQHLEGDLRRIANDLMHCRGFKP